MIEVKCPERFRDVVAFAVQVGALDQFLGRINYLASYALSSGTIADVKCELFPDFAPHSFAFVVHSTVKPIHLGGEWMRWFNGGLIYSGPGLPSDGSEPSLTVNLDPRDGKVHQWSVHT